MTALEKSEWCVYILECHDGTWYTGITNDLQKRIEAHSHGRGAKYTKGRGPFRLIFTGAYKGRNEASRAESAIKKLTRAQKEVFVKTQTSEKKKASR